VKYRASGDVWSFALSAEASNVDPIRRRMIRVVMIDFFRLGRATKIASCPQCPESGGWLSERRPAMSQQETLPPLRMLRKTV
jgi:hypothetical protein